MRREVVMMSMLSMLSMSGCGGHHLRGVYAPKGQLIGTTTVEQFNFTSDSDVQITIVYDNSVHPATYQLNGNQVIISADGNSMTLTRDSNGCIGNATLGTYCSN